MHGVGIAERVLALGVGQDATQKLLAVLGVDARDARDLDGVDSDAFDDGHDGPSIRDTTRRLPRFAAPR